MAAVRGGRLQVRVEARMLVLALVPLAAVAGAVASTLQPDIERRKRGVTPVISLNVVKLREIDHEGLPFTQGLEISHDGHHLVETSGAYPPGTPSYVRQLHPADGKTMKKQQNGMHGKFAEGIVRLPTGKWYMSTYDDKEMVEYTPDLEYVKSYKFPYVGWGLTRSSDSSSFLATDGTEFLYELQLTEPFSLISKKTVMCRGKPVHGLNELEMVENFLGQGPRLLGNVYLTRAILAIDPNTGHCTHVANLEGVGEPYSQSETSGFHACNGLAYNSSSNTWYVTGKNWGKMFEVQFVPDTADTKWAITKLDQFLGVQQGVAMMQLTQIPGMSLLDLRQNRSKHHKVGVTPTGVAKDDQVTHALTSFREKVEDAMAKNTWGTESNEQPAKLFRRKNEKAPR